MVFVNIRMENSELCRENSGKNSKTCGKITKCMVYCKHFHKQYESIKTHVEPHGLKD